MTRKLLWPVLVIGAMLVIAPFALQMPSRTAAGDRMLKDFQPLMQAAHVQTTADYYDNVFVPLGQIATQFTAATSDPQLQTKLAPLQPMLQPVIPIFKRVPAGLAWYQPLVRTMQGNVGDYAAVNALPPFWLFTWFFVIPGALLMLLAGYGLFHERLGRISLHRAHPTPV